MLTINQNTFCNHRAPWLPFVDNRFVINELVAISIVFFGLDVTNDAAKPDCILPIGDDGSLDKGCPSGKLIVIKINETLLSRKQQLCQKCKHWQRHFNSPISASKKNFTCFFSLNGSTTLQSRPFLKNIENFLCK